MRLTHISGILLVALILCSTIVRATETDCGLHACAPVFHAPPHRIVHRPRPVLAREVVVVHEHRRLRRHRRRNHNDNDDSSSDDDDHHDHSGSGSDSD